MKAKQIILIITYCLIFVTFSAILKLPSLSFPHNEPDEIIYMTLALKLLKTGNYNLKNTDILKNLSPFMYDRPLFHHPPLFPLFCSLFIAFNIAKYAVVASWLGHFLTIITLFIILRVISPESEANKFPLYLWLPLIGISFDPLLSFVSRKIWMDNLLCALSLISICLLFLSEKTVKFKNFFLILAGIFCGLAGLTKLTGLLTYPVLVTIILTSNELLSVKIKNIAIITFFVALVILPWFIQFYLYYKTFVPTFIKADKWAIEHYPFVKYFVNLPWYYYIIKIFLLIPAFGLALIIGILNKNILKDRIFIIAFIWILSVIFPVTIVSSQGVGFLMRHIIMVIPAIYIIISRVLFYTKDNNFLSFLLTLLIFLGSIPISFYMWNPASDEIYSIFENLKLIVF